MRLSNKKVIRLTVIIILGMIVCTTVYKIHDRHNKKLLMVVEDEFLYNASKCYNDDKCGTKVYLKDLYNNKYIEEKLSNPITKKYYSENSYVDLKKNIVKLVS